MRASLLELEAVVTVSTHRSFRVASDMLGMSPSALSRVISGLEARLRVRLFNRTTRSVALSEAGERFLALLAPALKGIDEAMDAVNDLRDTPTGTLRINTSEPAARQLFTPLVLTFLERYPAMKVDLVTEGRLVDIVAEGFDVGIRLAGSVPQDMVAISCGPSQRFTVVGSRKYFRNRPRPTVPGNLASHQCIAKRLPSGMPNLWEFHKDGDTVVFDPNGALRLDNHSLMVEAALRGHGLAYVAQWFAAPYLNNGRLIAVLDDWVLPSTSLCVYYPRNRHMSAGLRAFLDVVHEVATTLRSG